MSVTNHNSEDLCINTKKIYDWVTSPLKLDIEKMIRIEEEKAIDVACCHFNVPCNSEAPSTLWTNIEVTNITGTFSIHYQDGCEGELDVLVNGNIIATINKGQEFCTTVSNIESVEILCRGTVGSGTNCVGMMDIELVYKLADTEVDLNKVNCFLSDNCGSPIHKNYIDHLDCKEITDPNHRENTSITIENGKKVTLQMISLLLQGFVTVELFDQNNKKILFCVFPFKQVESLLLCAPTGTEIKCKITDATCNVFFNPDRNVPNCFRVCISLHLCLNTFVETNVNIIISGKQCIPRPKIINKSDKQYDFQKYY
ncbi:S-Ena type endospore appendage [Bacillus sp. 2205SS5-2]|uniref:S-Ena type endospore appendage n=1 Tax=Bacillus sp. 2205SS5-2 TaxID=3109031 RepID=UPI0030054A79